MDPSTTFGFGRFLLQGDAVSAALFAALVAMSVASWSLAAVKAIGHRRRTRGCARVQERFASAASLDDVRRALADDGAADPAAQLASRALEAHARHARHGATRLAEAGSAGDYVARTLRNTLDEETTRMESGLTALATIGATAPFVGLFGTVWGVYHALTAIGLGGAGSLERIAGPVGEALVMTGLGLAVAIPAVVAYNAFVRANRVAAARLDSFAFELHSVLTLGHAPAAPPPADGTQRLRAVAPATA